ncbi:MAG: hypothetical protein RL367_88 [Pseudomonadota bacterium]|jgi:hypothetical protein
MPLYPREEIQEMVNRFDQAKRDAEKTHDWSALGSFYTEDANYGWFLGPDEEVLFQGRKEIADHAMGSEMVGFEGWTFQYTRSIIDVEKAEVVSWGPYVPGKMHADGTPYAVAGLTGSWLHYGGNFQWSWQRDILDFGNLQATFRELIADGQGSDAFRQRMGRILKEQAENSEARFEAKGHYHLGKAPISMWDMAPLPKP